MDIHNIDDYLDLQDQTATNLLSTEQITQPQDNAEEWHSPLNDLLSNHTDNFYKDDWGLLQNSLQGTETGFIAPDSLIKQPVIQEEKRITRSKTAAKPPLTPPSPKKKKKTRAKKLYCICQQPYDGKPMVQCDKCEEWFHCTCVGFDPDSQEDIDWICQTCRQDVETKIQEQESPITDTAKTRQTRHRTQSQCLFSGCSNRTRADSFCSDVCARKHNESLGITPEQKPRTTRRASMRTAAISVSPKQKEDIKTVPSDNEQHDNDSDAHIEEEEEEEEEKQKEGSKTPPMDPSQMTEQQNPVRRNVIKNLTTILKSLMNTAMEKNPDMYDTDITVDERAENLAKSIENTMLQELGDLGKGQRHRTCGERYKNKFRSLLYNLKDKANQVFQLRVITHDLSPSELVSMSSEDMANPELKSMSELLREKGLKNSVMKLENVPIIKKTHKGDIIMVPKEENQNSMYSEQVQRELTKLETKANSSVEEKKPSISSFSPTNSNNGKVDPLDDILARIGIPANDESGVKRSSITMDNTDQEAKKRKVTLDVEQLLGEEEPFKVDEVDVNEPADKQDKKEEVMEVNKKEVLPTIWHGRVNMPQVAEFEASARQIGGRILSEAEWNDVLSPTMWIEGRIPTDRVTNYVTQTQYSTSREIILIEVEAQGGDNDPQSQTLLRYLDSRKRYAVVGHNKTKIKDFYLIPLYKVQQIPDCLYVVRVEETKRTSDLFLGVLVLTKQHQPENPSTNIPPQLLNVISQIPAIQQSSYVYPSSQPYQDSTYTSSPQQQQQQQPYYYRQNKSYQ